MFDARSFRKFFSGSNQLSAALRHAAIDDYTPSASFEPLEPRVLLSVSSPLTTTTDSAYVASADTSTTQEDTLLASALASSSPYDLSASISGAALPESVMRGDKVSVRLPLNVINNGIEMLRNKQMIDMAIYARPAGATDAAGDILVVSFTGQLSKPLKPGESTTFYPTVELPGSLADGEYSFVGVVDSTNQIDESNEGNNTAVTRETVKIIDANVALAASFSSESLPTSVEYGTGATGNVIVELTNTGNVAVDSAASVGVTLVIRPIGAAGSGSDIVIGSSSSASIAGIAPGATARVTTPALLPADVPAGDYTILAIIDAANAGITSSNTTFTATGSAIIAVDAPAPEPEPVPVPVPVDTTDLTGAISGENIVTSTVSDGKTSFRLPVVVGNNGSKALASDQLVDVAIYARPAGATDAASDIMLTSVPGLSVADLQVGSTQTFNVTTTLPRGVKSGQYRFVAMVDPSNTTGDDNPANNAGTSSTTVNVTEGYIELTAAVAATTVPSTVEPGNTFIGEVTTGITNIGNLHALADAVVHLTVVARPVGATSAASDIVVGTRSDQSVGYLYPAETDEFRVRLATPSNAPAGEYQLIVMVDATSAHVGDGRAVALQATGQTFTIGNGGTVEQPAPAPAPTPSPEPTPTDGDRINELAPGEIIESTSTAIARWDVVPYQTFAGQFKVGVVAFHINGIDRVEFKVNGVAAGVVTEMTMNTRTGVEEYWIALDGSKLPEGQITVEATVHPTNGTPRVLSGDYFAANDDGEYSLVLYNNTAGSFQRSQITVSTGAGLADALKTIADGGEILLRPGTYDIPDMGGASRQFSRWVTVRAADGVSPDQVLIKPDVRKTITIKGSKIQWQNVTFDFATIERLYPYKQDLHWFDNVTWTDSNGWATEYERYYQPLHYFGHGFFTDSVATDLIYGPVGMQLVRNATISKISGDVFQNSVVVLNSTVDMVDKSILSHHSDIFQFWAPPDTRILENRIAFNVVGTNLDSQHYFMRTGGGPANGESTFKDFAFVNINLGMMDGITSRDNANQLYTNNNHVLFIDIVEPHRFAFRGEGDALENEGFVPTDVIFEYSTLESLTHSYLDTWTEIYTRQNLVY